LGQNITIFSRPDNRIATHLVVRLEVTGDFSLHRLPDGDLQFEYQDEPGLDYSLLYAYDAVGRRLAAHLDVGQAGFTQDEETDVQAGTYIDLVLDDSVAQYPLQVSMLLSGLDPDHDWLTYGGLPLAHLGTSVATAGDVNGDGYSDVLIGAPDYNAGQHHRGEVYAFYGSPNGLRWDDHDWARPGNPAKGARMGESVATATATWSSEHLTKAWSRIMKAPCTLIAVAPAVYRAMVRPRRLTLAGTITVTGRTPTWDTQ
jgi:hypothetical protein